jgi:MFS transporter, NNP family, nitrate/nitrite transporter
MSAVLLLTPFVFGMALAHSPLAFILVRLGIGVSLAACQFWTSCMFNVRIVGAANATAAGWGNLGGGVMQLLMPIVYAGLTNVHTPVAAWRWAFFLPGCASAVARREQLSSAP